jgi:hypothetical protein
MRDQTRRLLAAATVMFSVLSLAACGGGGGHGGSKTHTVGGTLSGLGSGLSVTLVNNGLDSLTRSSNGTFTFSTGLKSGSVYSVTVGTQPAGQTCTVAGGTGTMGSDNITSVMVTCADVPKYTIGGTISGLGNGLSVTLLNNGGNALTINANGAFVFTTGIASGAAYAVTVGTQPTGQTCSVANGSGTMGAANVTNVSVTCSTNTYTVGGTLSGLGTGKSVTLLNNGGNSLTLVANGAFAFSTALAGGASYAVTVGSHPTGQTCSVTGGSGTVGSSNVTNIGVACTNNVAQQWSWKGGSNLRAPSGVYGVKGVPAASNAPGGRNWNGSWTEPGGDFWIFGGQGYDSTHASSVLNDLWKYDPDSGYWTWMGGSTTVNALGVYGTKGVPSTSNIPGAREFMTTWVDDLGFFFLFGGYGFDSAGTIGYLNDLWMYNPDNGMWTWVAGSNTVNSAGVYGSRGIEAVANFPGARYGAVVAYTDNYIWLFGGYGVDANGVALGYLNDLWRFNPANGRWTWMSGASTYGASGVYGSKGVADANNVPGSRSSTLMVVDPVGRLWLFGGTFVDSASNVSYYNDLWKYDTSSGQWTWVSGYDVANMSGVYGTQGTPDAGNVPGARAGMVGWIAVGFPGDLWIFGGAGYDSVGNGSTDLNDLWRYDVVYGGWTWVNGSKLAGAAGAYGTLGTPSATTQPGARDSATVWQDSRGYIWLFGGAGYDSAGVYDAYGLNDVFEYIP